MASLIQVRDLLALRGRMEATQISHTLHTPQPMIDAMLNQLEKMGKAVRIQEDADGCLSGSCKSCPEGKACLREWWALRYSDALCRMALRLSGLQMMQTSRPDSAFTLISGFFA